MTVIKNEEAKESFESLISNISYENIFSLFLLKLLKTLCYELDILTQCIFAKDTKQLGIFWPATQCKNEYR